VAISYSSHHCFVWTAARCARAATLLLLLLLTAAATAATAAAALHLFSLRLRRADHSSPAAFSTLSRAEAHAEANLGSLSMKRCAHGRCCAS